jgi:hypothetical protein
VLCSVYLLAQLNITDPENDAITPARRGRRIHSCPRRRFPIATRPAYRVVIGRGDRRCYEMPPSNLPGTQAVPVWRRGAHAAAQQL